MLYIALWLVCIEETLCAENYHFNGFVPLFPSLWFRSSLKLLSQFNCIWYPDYELSGNSWLLLSACMVATKQAPSPGSLLMILSLIPSCGAGSNDIKQGFGPTPKSLQNGMPLDKVGNTIPEGCHWSGYWSCFIYKIQRFVHSNL